MQAVALNFLACHAQRWLELSEQTVNGIDWNLPDTEESEDMVDAVSVEEFGHILEPAYPPQASVLDHLVPVVGRESPVLAVRAESIWRCSGLSVEVEVTGLRPYIATVAVHSDRNVALEDNSVSPCILVDVLHLGVEDVLYEVVETYGLICFRPR